MSVFKPGLLDGKVAFMAGATSGINLGIAERFAAEGAKVYVISRDPEKVDRTVEQLTGAGGTAAGRAADVRDYDQVAAAIADAAGRWGALDIVLSGAAGNFLAPAAKLSSNGFRTVVEIDLLGTFHVFRASYEHLTTPGASLIAITAPQSKQPHMYQIHACAAKAGVDMVTKCLALEWGPAGIRVNAISPGPITETEGMRRLAPSPEIVSAFEAKLPLGRFGTKGEIADAALFLATEASRYVTGIVLDVDGGMVLGDLFADALPKS